jgi:hypothetical protein
MHLKHGKESSSLDEHAGRRPGFIPSTTGEPAEYAGKLVVVVPLVYTDKIGSQCGHRVASLTLAERWAQCDCRFSLDRDQNAALNLLAL